MMKKTICKTTNTRTVLKKQKVLPLQLDKNSLFFHVLETESCSGCSY